MFYLADLIGSFVFAMSGAIAGRQKQMDIFGMFILGLVTATGGGTLRSLLIAATPPPVLTDAAYVLIAAAAAILSFFAETLWERFRRVVSFFDALGLGIFVCIGVQVALAAELSWWACAGLGMVTASFGGVIRDLLRVEIPLLFRTEIYATAALLGGLLYLGAWHAGLPDAWNILLTTTATAGIRLLSIRYHLDLPR